MTRTPDPWPGTLDLPILRTLQKDALHGVSPALHRLELQGWLEAEWKVLNRANGSECRMPSRT